MQLAEAAVQGEASGPASGSGSSGPVNQTALLGSHVDADPIAGGAGAPQPALCVVSRGTLQLMTAESERELREHKGSQDGQKHTIGASAGSSLSTQASAAAEAAMSHALAEAASSDAGLRRAVELGARIVSVPNGSGSTSVTLQMPRGNLEQVRPRALVLAVIRRLIAMRRYAAALELCRS